MCITAAQAIANYAEKKGIWEEYIIPTMDEMEMFVEEAVAVGLKAMQQGIARKKLSRQSLREKVSSKIVEAQKMTRSLMRNRVIAPLPE